MRLLRDCGLLSFWGESRLGSVNLTVPSEVSLLSAQAGGGQGSVGASKSFREQREAVFQPREFALLSNCQAICLPYDGAQSLAPTRVYLKPHYLPRTLPYWRAKVEGKL